MECINAHADAIEEFDLTARDFTEGIAVGVVDLWWAKWTINNHVHAQFSRTHNRNRAQRLPTLDFDGVKGKINYWGKDNLCD